MTPNPTIIINGTAYPGPTLDDLSFDELEVAEQLGAPMVQPGDTPDLRHVRWLKALVVIALQRAGEDTTGAGELRVNEVEFKDYPEVTADSPPPNRAARRAGHAAKPVSAGAKRGA